MIVFVVVRMSRVVRVMRPMLMSRVVSVMRAMLMSRVRRAVRAMLKNAFMTVRVFFTHSTDTICRYIAAINSNMQTQMGGIERHCSYVNVARQVTAVRPHHTYKQTVLRRIASR